MNRIPPPSSAPDQGPSRGRPANAPGVGGMTRSSSTGTSRTRGFSPSRNSLITSYESDFQLPHRGILVELSQGNMAILKRNLGDYAAEFICEWAVSMGGVLFFARHQAIALANWQVLPIDKCVFFRPEICCDTNVRLATCIQVKTTNVQIPRLPSFPTLVQPGTLYWPLGHGSFVRMLDGSQYLVEDWVQTRFQHKYPGIALACRASVQTGAPVACHLVRAYPSPATSYHVIALCPRKLERNLIKPGTILARITDDPSSQNHVRIWVPVGGSLQAPNPSSMMYRLEKNVFSIYVAKCKDGNSELVIYPWHIFRITYYGGSPQFGGCLHRLTEQEVLSASQSTKTRGLSDSAKAVRKALGAQSII